MVELVAALNAEPQIGLRLFKARKAINEIFPTKTMVVRMQDVGEIGK